MARRVRRRRADPGADARVLLPPAAVAAIRAQLPAVADDVVAQVIEAVPAYEDAFAGSMGETIRSAVQIALGGFLSLVTERRGPDALAPRASAVDGAYQLGRGEARSGRTSEALLSAYRIGARVSWQHLSRQAVDAGIEPSTMASFAEQVFAYIDELSAASVAGHTDESATAGRVRQRLLERIVQQVLEGAPEAAVLRLAERAEWPVPTTLTAVMAPEDKVRPAMQQLPKATLQAADLPELEDAVMLLVPDMHGRRRGALLRAVEGQGCLVGPPRPWRDVRASYDRVVRAHGLGIVTDTESHLPRLVLTADADALADLREQVLAPLADLRPASRAKLAETLRAWLLHQGRRDEVAEALFVHPQTVRYRLGQLREAYGDALDDPQTVLALTIALGADEPVADDPVAGDLAEE